MHFMIRYIINHTRCFSVSLTPTRSRSRSLSLPRARDKDRNYSCTTLHLKNIYFPIFIFFSTHSKLFDHRYYHFLLVISDGLAFSIARLLANLHLPFRTRNGVKTRKEGKKDEFSSRDSMKGKKKEMYEMLMNAKLNPVETVRHGLSNDKLISLPYVIRGNQLTKF